MGSLSMAFHHSVTSKTLIDMLGTIKALFIKKVLLLVNGAYGRRMQTICEYMEIPVEILEFPEDQPVSVRDVENHLTKHESYSVISVVHCETSSGVLNPVEELGRAIRVLQPKTSFFVDAMSSFGAIPLDIEKAGVDFIVSSANKCLQGVPGFAFVIARKQRLLICKGNARSLSLDLVAQQEGLDRDGQFRFTPPTHCILAFCQALKEFMAEGGVQARASRYRENCAVIQQGMAEMGFRQLLAKEHARGYIITSFHFPTHANFNFEEFYKRLGDLGQVIYPGKVTQAACFRIGHIGHLTTVHMRYLLHCIRSVLVTMEIPLPVC